MRRRSTNWASSGRGFNRHPSGGWAWWWKEASHHVPVLLKEAIDFLNVRRGGTYIDATVGLGGHSYEIAKRLGAPGHLIGLDKDPAALDVAERTLDASQRFMAEGEERDFPPRSTALLYLCRAHLPKSRERLRHFRMGWHHGGHRRKQFATEGCSARI